jgi:hypothetical protein
MEEKRKEKRRTFVAKERIRGRGEEGIVEWQEKERK